MNHRRRNLSLPGLFAIAAVGLIAIAGLGRDSSKAAGEPGVLKTIPDSVLAGGSLHLSTPSQERAAAARIDRATAEDVALKHTAGKLIETALAEVDDQLSEPSLKCLCWVVASDPPGGVYIHQPIPRDGQPVVQFVPSQTYYLDFIDAVTGQWLYAAEGAHGADQVVK